MKQLFGEAFEVDPKVAIRRGSHVPFVEMADVKPWTRTVHTTTHRTFSGGSRFLDGDVLLARITPSLENGKTSIYRAAPSEKDGPAAGSTEFIVVRGREGVSLSEYAYYLLRTDELRNHLIANMNGSSGRQRVRPEALNDYPVDLPTFTNQQRILEILSLLDDKIDLNHRRRLLCRELGLAIVNTLTRNAPYVPLSYYAASISRGIAPKYYKGEETIPVQVLNQRCIRDGWVSRSSARLMLPRKREKKPAVAEFDDLLVNSTGEGTLGRVGRWSYQEPIYVDSHVTVVKADSQHISPVLLPYLVFPLQAKIEEMAEGSTGQTELSPSNLGSLQLPLLAIEEQKTVTAQLSMLEELAHHCSIETGTLAELRDTLLPELMSGRMRVDEAGRLVAGVLGEEPMEDAQSR